MIGCNCAVCTSPDQHDNRLRSSIMVSSDTTTLVVDTTPDFRYQLLRTHTQKLDAILFTHSHMDHIAGLDDVRAFNFFSGKAMDLHASSATATALINVFHYAFAENKYPGVPDLNLLTIDGNAFRVGDIPVQPIEVMHYKMPVLGFRFGDFTYITDANSISDQEKEKIKGSRVLVLNALRKEKHISHFTLDEAVELATELAVPEVYFAHISHQLGKHEDVNKELPLHIQLAHDGLVIRL